MIGKNNVKPGISSRFKNNNGVINDYDQICNTCCHLFTNVGQNHATAIHQSNKQFTFSELP